MDDFTERHLQQWLDRSVDHSERSQTESDVRLIVSEYPDLLERMSWLEIRDLSERNRKMLK